MPTEIAFEFNVETFLAICGAFTVVCVALDWARKTFKPIGAKLSKPMQTVQNELQEIEEHQKLCSQYFENDKERLDEHEEVLKEITADNKMIMKSILLLMKHAETGNCTGEVAKGRSELENYIVQK